VKALSRTYPQATAGVPINMAFFPDTSLFRYIYAINTSITMPTEIYLNEAWYYPNGYTVNVSPANALTWTSPRRNLLYFKPTASAADGTRVLITINRK